jgi:hypothetical protein
MAIPTDTCAKDTQGNIQSSAIKERLRIRSLGSWRRLCIYPPLAVGLSACERIGEATRATGSIVFDEGDA